MRKRGLRLLIILLVVTLILFLLINIDFIIGAPVVNIGISKTVVNVIFLIGTALVAVRLVWLIIKY